MRFPASVLALALSLLLLSFLPASLAAYVQPRGCLENNERDYSHGGFSPLGLRASLTANPDVHGLNRLELRLYGELVNMVTCDQDKLLNVTSSVRIDSFGSSSTFAGLFESSSCANIDPATQPQYARFRFAYDVPSNRFLDTYWLTVELVDHTGPLSSCVNAYLTPDIGQAASQTALWAPVAILMVVLVAGLGTQLRSLASSGASSGQRNQEPRRAHIVRIGDCISYLQFIFFAGSLTLSYPGFLRPVASKMDWSTLMFPFGIVSQKPWYDGIRDGIYEINGTFGGTEGLELTTQVIGGTVTVSTWLNTITLAAVIFFVILGLMILGQRLRKAHHSILGNKAPVVLRSADDNAFTVQAAALAALRLFCSYFLLPLVAWSTYMLTYANGIPVYYTAAGTVMVSCLILLVWFVMWRGSPNRMGYLLVESIKRPNDQSNSNESWMQEIYAMIVFVLLFLRGAAIGGLQMSGLLQLVVLLVTEVFQMMLFAFSFLSNPLASQTGRMSALRITALLLEIGFVPGVASFSAQIILGFAILLIHVLVLVFLFFLPGVYDLYVLFTRRSSASSKQENGGSRNHLQDPHADQAPVSIGSTYLDEGDSI
ncbi:hypothetical protein E4U55_004916 [Claviceps digitariae]|nr:hypothetical protein E4U55_004916 [Claviceps digitariae]